MSITRMMGVISVISIMSFMSVIVPVYGSMTFTNYTSSIVIKETGSELILENVDKVNGWSELSITKDFGKNGEGGWVEQYPNAVLISQEGSQDPNTNLIVSNSNALNYGIKNNSNAIMNLPGGGAFTEEEKTDLLEDVRTHSNAFLYCCKNVSNALIYGLKNNSNAIVALLPRLFTAVEKFEVLEDIRTTSNAFLYCCKNSSNALAYGIKNNSNVIVTLLPGLFAPEEKLEVLEDIRTTSNAFLYCCKNSSNALVYGIRNNSNAIMSFPLTICGCCDECEPVARALRSPRYAEDGYSGSTGRTPRYAQGATRGERVENTSRRSFSEAGWSPDKKFLAVITEIEEGQEIQVYALDGNDSLRLVAHVCAPYYAQPTSSRWLRCSGVASKGRDDGVHICSVAWSADGYYLGVEIERLGRDGLETEFFVYTFDKETQTLQELPEIDEFVRGRV